MQLYGTVTSPYVRRIRYVLEDHGLSYALVDAFQPEGQRALREVNPLWKVPTLEVGGEALWDSEVILDRLFADHGLGSLRAETEASCWPEARMRATIDELLGTLIKLFYLQKDGVEIGAVPYLQKDEARARSTLAWLDGQLRGPWCSPVDGFGRTELALYSALDWATFRGMASLDDHSALRAFLDAHRSQPGLLATALPR